MLKACVVCGRRSPLARCPRHPLRSRPRGNSFEPLRQAILLRDAYTCQIRIPGVCTRVATVVDHIVELAAGGSDDPINLRGACAPCNHARQREGGPFDHGRSGRLR
jgi:5-methylcytosine-specific restriction endonuclease McrA